MVKFLKNCSQNVDLLQSASTISDEDFDSILSECMNNITDELVLQEINQKKYILNKNEEFNAEIESILKEAKEKSILEFSVAGMSMIVRDDKDYKQRKNKCNNMVTKYLFHGTSANSSSLITTSNFMNAKTAFFGEGIYMTDMLDYAGFYAFEPEEGNKFKNHHAIRKKDDSFTIVASQVFYDNSKFEYCYEMMQGTQIQQNGVRFVNVNAEGDPLSKNQTKEKGYNKFIGTEFVFPGENQILPIYSFTLKRNEYYCLWKDYHFTHQTLYSSHANHVKKLAEQILEINVYGVGEFEEALRIIRRKKYNKVILLSNVGNDIEKVKQFINEIRNILEFDITVLFFTTMKHLSWIKNFKNALFTTHDDFFLEYIKDYKTINGLNKLKDKIENYYSVKFTNFNPDLSYPLYEKALNNGSYKNLIMD